MTVPQSQVSLLGRMEKLARLPVFFSLDGKRAVLAGGNAAAAWKAELLAAAGARVDVYAEMMSDEVLALAAAPPRGAIHLHARGWTAADLAGAAIAVGAFAEEAGAVAFAQAARTAGIPVNIIDRPAFCDFAFGAIVNRSPLVIGISTDGAAPVFAQAVRAKIETLIPRGFAVWAAAAQSWRAALKRAVSSAAARRKFWQLFAEHAVIHAGKEPLRADFDRLMSVVQGCGRSVENGTLTVVDVESGDPDLLTLRAVRALQAADIILFDERVSPEVLDFARREARKMLVGSAGFGSASSEAKIDALIAGLVRQGRRVVRLNARAAITAGRDHAATFLNSPAAPSASAGRNGAAA